MIILLSLLLSAAEPVETCRTDVPQSVMNECAERQALAADAQRKLEFTRLIEETQKTSNLLEDEREYILYALHYAEDRWEAYRYAECHKIGAMGGGSMGLQEDALCRRDFSLERSKDHKVTLTRYKYYETP